MIELKVNCKILCEDTPFNPAFYTCSRLYALAICNHAPSPRSWGGGDGGIAKGLNFDFPLVRENCLHGLYYVLQKKQQCNENIADCGGN